MKFDPSLMSARSMTQEHALDSFLYNKKKNCVDAVVTRLANLAESEFLF